MNLCCTVNAVYICEACGFRECEDHWQERLRADYKARKYHLKGDSGLERCATTGKAVRACHPIGIKDLTIWKPI